MFLDEVKARRAARIETAKARYAKLMTIAARGGAVDAGEFLAVADMLGKSQQDIASDFASAGGMRVARAETAPTL